MFGAIASLLGSGISSIAQGANARSRMRFDKEENRQTRNWNLMLAEKQNQWNIDQWDRENTYNLPANQMQRFAQAGLNPDLIYGQSNLSAGSPALTSGAPATPTPSDGYAMLPTWSGLAEGFNQGRLIDAQIDNLKSDTLKKEKEAGKTVEETKGINIDNVYKALHHEQQLSLGETQIQLNIADKKCSLKEAEEISARITEIGQNIKTARQNILESKQRIASMKHDDVLKSLDYALRQKEVQAKIANFAADTKLKTEQATEICRLWYQKYLGLKETARGLALDNDAKVIENRYLDGTLSINSAVQRAQGEAVISASNVQELLNDFKADNAWWLAINEIFGTIGLVFSGSASAGYSKGVNSRK